MGEGMLPERMGFGQHVGPRRRLSIPAGKRNIGSLEFSPAAPHATRSPDLDHPPGRSCRRRRDRGRRAGSRGRPCRSRIACPVRRRMGTRAARGPVTGDVPGRSPLRRSLAGRLGGGAREEARRRRRRARDTALDPGRAAFQRGQAEPGTVPATVPGLGRCLRLGPAVPADHAASWRADLGRNGRAHPVRNCAGLPELDRQARGPRRLRGPDDRADARGHATRTRAAEGDHAAGSGTDLETDRRGPHRKRVLQAIPLDAGGDPAGRAGKTACRGADCDRPDGRARIPQAAGFRHEGIPAGLPRFGRRLGRAWRRSVVPGSRRLVHDDESHGRRDP